MLFQQKLRLSGAFWGVPGLEPNADSWDYSAGILGVGSVRVSFIND